MAITSKLIDLVQLDKELGSQGLIWNFEDETKKIILPSETSEITEEQLEAAIKAHIPIPAAVPTPAEKLFAATGLTVEEYKALGL